MPFAAHMDRCTGECQEHEVCVCRLPADLWEYAHGHVHVQIERLLHTQLPAQIRDATRAHKAAA